MESISGSSSCGLNLTCVRAAYASLRRRGAKIWWRSDPRLLVILSPLGERESHMQMHAQSCASSETEGWTGHFEVCQAQLKKLYPRFPERDNI